MIADFANQALKQAIASEVIRAMLAESGITGDITAEAVRAAAAEEALRLSSVSSAEYVSSATTINFYNVSGDTVSTIDASAFIKDGMIDNVYLDSGNTLCIVFNTDSGKETIQIDLTEFIDPSNYFTKDEIDEIIAGLYMLDDVSLSGGTLTFLMSSGEGEVPISVDLTEFIDPDDYYKKGEVDDIVTGINTTIQEVVDGVTNVFTAYTGTTAEVLATKVTSGDVKNQIEGYNYITSGDAKTQIEGYNYVTSGDVKTQVEGYNYVTSGDVKTQVEGYNYVNSGDVKSQVESYAYVNSGDVKSQIEGYNYVNSGDVKSQVEAYDYVTSGDVKSQVEAYDYATKSYVTGATSGLQETLVSGTNIKTVGGNSLLGSGNIAWPTVDTVLSSASTNAIENGTVTRALNEKADKSEIPTAVSELTNDAGYLTSADTVNYVTSGDVKTQVEEYEYVTSGDVKAQIEEYGYAVEDENLPYTAAGTSERYFFGDVILDSGTSFENASAASVAQFGNGNIVWYHQTSPTGVDETPGVYDVQEGYFVPDTLVYELGVPYEVTYSDTPVGFDFDFDEFWAVINVSAQTITFFDSIPVFANSVLRADEYNPDFTTPGDVKAQIEAYGYLTSADTQNFVTSGDVKSQIEDYGYLTSADTQNYVTSGEVKTQIEGYNYLTSADTQNFVTSGEVKTQVEGYNYVNSGDVKTQVEAYGYLTSADTVNYVTSGEVKSQVEAYDYVTSGEVKSQIEGYNYITSGDVKTQVEAYDYVTSGDVKTQVEGYNYLTSADTQNFVTSGEVKSQVEAYDYVTSGDVKTQIEGYNYLTSADTQNFVTSGEVKTQIEDYNYLTSADTQNFVTSGEVKTQIEDYNYLTSADTQNFVTSGEVKSQIEGYNYLTSADTVNYVTSGEVKTQIEDYNYLTSADTVNYVTSGDVSSQITAATSGLQETLVSGTNIKTINNESILGSGNISISGGGTGGTIYTAGDNISLDNDTISVTGITSKVNTIWVDGGSQESTFTGYYAVFFRNGAGPYAGGIGKYASNNSNIVSFRISVSSNTNDSYWLRDSNANPNEYYGIVNSGDTIELDTIYDTVNVGTDTTNLTNPIVVSGFTEYTSSVYLYLCWNPTAQTFWVSESLKYQDDVTQELAYGPMPTAQDGSVINTFVYDGAALNNESRAVLSKVTTEFINVTGSPTLYVRNIGTSWKGRSVSTSTLKDVVPVATQSANGVMSASDKTRFDEINDQLAIYETTTIGSSTEGDTTEYKLKDQNNQTFYYFSGTDINGLYVVSLPMAVYDNRYFTLYINSTSYYWDNNITINSMYLLPMEKDVEQGDYQMLFYNKTGSAFTLYIIWDTVNSKVYFNTSASWISGYKSAVGSSSIHTILSISQSDYDALTTKDANTLYLIV